MRWSTLASRLAGPRPKTLGAVALLGLLSWLPLRPALGEGLVPYGNDLILNALPLLATMQRHLLRGELVLWSPEVAAGVPLDALYPVFHPLAVLWLLLPLARATAVSYWLSLWMAGTGLYAYLRTLALGRQAALLGGVTFMLSGYLFNHVWAGHHALVMTASAVPWVLAGLERALQRRVDGVVLTAAALAVAAAASFPQVYLYTLYLTAGYALYRTWSAVRQGTGAACGAVHAALGIGSGLLLASPLLLLWLRDAGQILRSGGLSLEAASRFSLPISYLPALLVADPFGTDPRGSLWGHQFSHELYAYLGPAVLALALTASSHPERRREVVFFATAALLSLLVALGEGAPGFALLHRALPGFASLRVPAKLLLVTTLSLAVLAGLGLDALVRGARTGLLRWILLLAAVALGGTAVLRWLVIAGVLPGTWPTVRSPQLDTVEQAVLRSVVILAGLGLAALALRWRAGFRPATVLISGLLAVDLLLYAGRYVVPTEADRFLGSSTAIAGLKDLAPGQRFLALDGTVRHYAGLLEPGLYDVQSEYPLTLRRYWELVNLRPAVDLDAASERAFVRDYDARLARLLSVGGVLARHPIVDPSLVLVEEDEETHRYRVRQPVPRAYLVHDILIEPDEARALRLLSDPAFDPRKQAILANPLEEPPGTPGQASRASIRVSEAERVVVGVETQTGGLLVLTDVWYPGWRVRIDGRTARLLRANHALRAVEVPAGRHEVAFTYEPPELRWGAFLATLTGLGLLALYRRERRSAA